MASFSNVHFEFNGAANFLNVDYHNETKKFADFAEIVAGYLLDKMIYDSKHRIMTCSAFQKTFTTHVTEPKRKILAQCRDVFISRFTDIKTVSPVSINNVEGTVFNVSVLFRFSGFNLTYSNVTLSIENEKPRHSSASMVFHENSYFRLNMSFDTSFFCSARLLAISLPHYCVAVFEMPDISDNETYLVTELRPHVRHHFETVEKQRLLKVLYGFVELIVNNTWFGDIISLISFKGGPRDFYET